MSSSDQIGEALNSISGAEIESQLIQFAKIGGEPSAPIPEQPERYTPTRLALTEADHQGREYVLGLMEEVGLATEDSHPLALLGTMHGSDPSLAPVTILSHFDTVPEADMYDGVLGIMGGLAVTKALKEAGLQPRHSIQVLALTGEESSRFNFALFGSRSVFAGLTNDELAASDKDGTRIMDELDEEAAVAAQFPLFGSDLGQLTPPYAAIELHVEQGSRLEDGGYDLGIVDAIAAPVRHAVYIGDAPVFAEQHVPPHNAYFELVIAGRADHSGATPMGLEHRADGLLEAAELLIPLLEDNSGLGGLDILSIDISGQALNKIPGITHINLHIGGNTKAELTLARNILTGHINAANEMHDEYTAALGPKPLALREVVPESHEPLLDREEMRQRYCSALDLVRYVNSAADNRAETNVVGTVGTFNQSADGQIKLGLDVRGIDSLSRDAAMQDIKGNIEYLSQVTTIKLSERLPGSGDPVSMDHKLVRSAQMVIEQYSLGTSTTLFSAAGHDTQNAARAGIPSVMLFSPSRGGIAHNPDAYTSPEQLERGVKALTALVMQLAL